MMSISVSANSAGDPLIGANVCRNLTWQDLEVKQPMGGLLANPDSSAVRIGDPPDGWWLGGGSERVWIGDFPPSQPPPWNIPPTFIPPVEIIPIGPSFWPLPNTNYIVTGPLLWRFEYEADCIKLSTDLPGVKPGDLKVEIDLSVLKVIGFRHDTKENITRTTSLDSKYDPQTCEAALENGVLTVIVKKRAEHMPRRIKVKVK